MAGINWRTDGVRRGRGRPPKNPPADGGAVEPRGEFTIWGNLWPEATGDVSCPDEGFARHYGDTALDTVVALCGENPGARAGGAQLLRKEAVTPKRTIAGCVYLHGARLVYMTLESSGGKPFTILKFGGEACYAIHEDRRWAYAYALKARAKPAKTFAEKVRINKQREYLLRKHIEMSERMDAAMHISPTAETLTPFYRYAEKHGLKITRKRVAPVRKKKSKALSDAT